MAVSRKEIVKFCEELLETKKFEDYCHNGLHVEGTDMIDKIITGVSLSKKLIEAAIEKKAQMIIVHHGLFGNQIENPPVIKGVFKNRLKMLLEHDINLLGFHLPLDAHDEIGNNISLCQLLGVNYLEPVEIGFVGEIEESMKFTDFDKLVNEKLKTKTIVLANGPERVKKIGIVSGGSSFDIHQFADYGIDTFVCGDLRENTVREVEELGINFINAGHYNTEKLGIQNLGEEIADKFKVDVEFVDIPNDV